MPDKLWERVEPLLNRLDPPASTGRPPADRRRVLDAIIFRSRTSCQWNHIPRVYGDDSTIYRCFDHWYEVGFFKKLWARLVKECDELQGVQWKWQAADCMLGKGPVWGGAVGPNPTDRGKNGSKKSVVTDGDGGPLGAIVAAANVNDDRLLRQTLEAIVVPRPRRRKNRTQHLSLDKAYDTPTGKRVVAQKHYIPHIRRKGETPVPKSQRKYPARRWVVERTFAWLSKCHALLVRYDTDPQHYLGLLQFACALLWFRRLVMKQVDR
ncbi:MAG: IS5 family transposase [Chloroflexi bacterium]|nr:IS5 family transposase [Chloroflexota bacterium]